MSMSIVRTTFCTVTARGYGGASSPSMYGLNGTIPALVSRSVGSTGISDALGTTVWSRSSKKSRKTRRISLESMEAQG